MHAYSIVISILTMIIFFFSFLYLFSFLDNLMNNVKITGAEWESTLSPSTLKLPSMLQSWVQTPFPQYDSSKLMVKGNKVPNGFNGMHPRKHHSHCFCQAYEGDVEQESSSDDDLHLYEHASRSPTRRSKKANKFTTVSVNLPALSKLFYLMDYFLFKFI